MLRSFFIITLRILWRNKVTSFINIISLAIGFAAFIMIMLYVYHEFSYDKFNENYNRIYRLEIDNHGSVPPILADLIKDKIPEVVNATRIYNYVDKKHNYAKYRPTNRDDDERQVRIQDCYYADNSIFNVFTLPFVQGDPTTALVEPNTIVLTESIAKTIFGEKNPIGETLQFYKNEHIVTGIIKDVKNSHLNISGVLISMETLANEAQITDHEAFTSFLTKRWVYQPTYLLLSENHDPNIVKEKIDLLLSEIYDEGYPRLGFEQFSIRPLGDIYFNGALLYGTDYSKYGDLKLIQIFMTIAVFILVLACLNYINLTTARAILRSKEVALKKVVGSSKSLLRYQFILESILVSIFSFLLAITIVQTLIPTFNQLAMVNISFADQNRSLVWILSLVVPIIIGVVSGFYPASFITSTNSVSLLKGQTSGSKGVMIRRILLTFQFTITVILTIGIFTIYHQLNFIRNKDLGFNKELILNIRFEWAEFDKTPAKENIIREKLLQNPNISKVAFAGWEAEHMSLGGDWIFECEGVEVGLRGYPVSPEYFNLMEIKIKEGRNFSRDHISDFRDHSLPNTTMKVILNEAAVRQFNLKLPVGKIINGHGQTKSIPFEILGVISDFHTYSLHHEIKPRIFWWSNGGSNAYIKISPHNIPSTLKYIENELTQFNLTPFVFEYSFLDDTLARHYQSDEQTSKIIGYFTILAIIIACMGLFALSSFMAVRRTKEIGIRKVLGASSKTIFIMLSREYIKWILLSALIASPIAWILMNKWLETFAYRIELGPGIFILAALLSLVIGLITVGWQALKSAVANPVESLRYE